MKIMIVGLACLWLAIAVHTAVDVPKVSPSGAVHPGCYRWSDGTVTCAPGWRRLTEDQVYGCTPANQAPNGECK